MHRSLISQVKRVTLHIQTLPRLISQPPEQPNLIMACCYPPSRQYTRNFNAEYWVAVRVIIFFLDCLQNNRKWILFSRQFSRIINDLIFFSRLCSRRINAWNRVARRPWRDSGVPVWALLPIRLKCHWIRSYSPHYIPVLTCSVLIWCNHRRAEMGFRHWPQLILWQILLFVRENREACL